MNNYDTRWEQRFSNYTRAFNRLKDAVSLNGERQLSDLEKQGLIQAFEFTHELAWKVIKDYFVEQGNNEITGSRDAVRSAFKNELIIDGEGWMKMIVSRNMSSHTYDNDIANEIVDDVVNNYYGLFQDFQLKMQGLLKQDSNL